MEREGGGRRQGGVREEAERLPMGGRGDFVGAGEVLRGCRGDAGGMLREVAGGRY